MQQPSLIYIVGSVDSGGKGYFSPEGPSTRKERAQKQAKTQNLRNLGGGNTDGCTMQISS
jgi:hypothetical protein